MRDRWLILGVGALLVAGCRAGTNDQGEAFGAVRRANPNANAQPNTEQQSRGRVAVEQPVAAGAACNGVGPAARIQRAADDFFAVVDQNRDGRISKDEATNAADFIVGGLFLKADLDGDGRITPAEGKQVRQQFMNDHPAFASMVHDIKQSTDQKSPFGVAARLLDVNYDKPITRAVARDAAKTLVDDVFQAADKDRDGAITMAEARAAAGNAIGVAAGMSFQAADQNGDGKLSEQEFSAALRGPEKVAFDMADTNHDGVLSPDEAAAALAPLTGGSFGGQAATGNVPAPQGNAPAAPQGNGSGNAAAMPQNAPPPAQAAPPPKQPQQRTRTRVVP
ncbi:MAG TPA: EF-hand domain-containing protein [Minicystis sp.]|nr:EF-hand domain-containing protein [Minicystis sp.]